jgi:Hemerythrin HHE cation binding domain
MGDLVAELKKEHAALAALLGEIKARGFGSPEVARKLLLVRHGLSGHLRKEDEQLYPVLRRAAERDERLRHLVDVFAREMTEVARTAHDFFTKYAEGGDGAAFMREFGRVAALLAARIRNEEALLYAAYEKLVPAT